MAEEKKVVLTYEGLKQREQELEELKTVRRKEVAEKIKEARIAGEIHSVMPLDDQLNSNFEDTQEFIEKEELIAVITEVLEHSTQNDQLVIQLYYFEELSFKEISEVLEVSESRVSQIHRAVIRKIRQYLEKRGLDG